MNICAKCGKKTNSDYMVGQEQILCAECAGVEITKLADELSEAIHNLIDKKTALNKERIRLKQLDCKHEWINTGYGRFIGETFESLCYCPKCKDSIYRSWEGDWS